LTSDLRTDPHTPRKKEDRMYSESILEFMQHYC
jgi:hypothetical protein